MKHRSESAWIRGRLTPGSIGTKSSGGLVLFFGAFFWLVFEFFFPFCCGGSEAVSDGTMSQIQPREVRSLSKNRLHLVGTGNQDRKFIAQSPRPELEPASVPCFLSKHTFLYHTDQISAVTRLSDIR